MSSSTSGGVSGAVRALLRVEGLAVFGLALYVFARGGHSWALFAILFFVPDVSFAAYLAGPRVGAFAYNALHSYVGPVALGIAFVATGRPPVLATIWAAHIGFDRMLGYGLKYASSFGDTHLGPVGRRPPAG